MNKGVLKEINFEVFLPYLAEAIQELDNASSAWGIVIEAAAELLDHHDIRLSSALRAVVRSCDDRVQNVMTAHHDMRQARFPS